MKTWHIITCEFPPQVGGVSDYTGLLAQQLTEAGDAVHVWAPANASGADKLEGSVQLHRSLGNFDRHDFAVTETGMDALQPSPRTLLVQYVPHGYGHRSLNVAFCKWIESLARKGDRVQLMVHEPFLAPGEGSWKQRIATLVHRHMMRILLRSVRHVFISIPAWEERMRDCAPRNTKFEWLPIPATIPRADVPAQISARLSLGHLGTYSREVTKLLLPALPKILNEAENCELVLMGRGAEQFASILAAGHPRLAGRIRTTGLLTDNQLSAQISGCALMLQPFPDGLTSRRTSLMNALSHGVAVVSNRGHLTEDLWENSGAVCLCPPDRFAEACIELLNDRDKRSQFAARGHELYTSRFDWPNIITRLRSSTE